MDNHNGVVGCPDSDWGDLDISSSNLKIEYVIRETDRLKIPLRDIHNSAYPIVSSCINGADRYR